MRKLEVNGLKPISIEKKPLGNHIPSIEWRRPVRKVLPEGVIVFGRPLVKGGGSYMLKMETRWVRGAPLNKNNPYVVVENLPDGGFAIHPWDESKYGEPKQES